MNAHLKTSALEEYNRILSGPNPVTHAEFAALVLANNRTVVNLSVQQIRQMAAAILVLDHQLEEATHRMVAMLADEAEETPFSKPAEETVVLVNLPKAGEAKLRKALQALAIAHSSYEKAKYSSGENLARQKFEAAALEVAKICGPNKRKTS